MRMDLEWVSWMTGKREGGREARVLPFRASESNVESAMSPRDHNFDFRAKPNLSLTREEEDKV